MRAVRRIDAGDGEHLYQTTKDAALDLNLMKKDAIGFLQEDQQFASIIGEQLGYGPQDWVSAEALAKKFNVDRRLITREAAIIKTDLRHEVALPGKELQYEKFSSYHTAVDSYFLSPELARLVSRNLLIKRFGIPAPEFRVTLNDELPVPLDVGTIGKSIINLARKEYRDAYPLIAGVRYPEEYVLRVVLPKRYYKKERPVISEREYVMQSLGSAVKRGLPNAHHLTLPAYAREVAGTEGDWKDILSLIRITIASWNKGHPSEAQIRPEELRRPGTLVPQDYYSKAILVQTIGAEVSKCAANRTRIKKEDLVSIALEARRRGTKTPILVRQLKERGCEVYLIAPVQLGKTFSYVKRSDLLTVNSETTT